MLSLHGLTRHIDPKPSFKYNRKRAYSCADLVNICLPYIELPYEQWTADRKNALRDFDQWQSNWAAKCTLEFTIPDPARAGHDDPFDPTFSVPTTDEMDTLIGHIDIIFFGGLLQDVDFVWKQYLCSYPNGNWITAGDGQGSRLGQINGPDEDDLETRLVIWLDPAPHALWEGQDDRHRVLDTLLHECVHAFLALHGCQSATCPCIEQSNRDMGITGHGVSWVQLSTHVMDLWQRCSATRPLGNLGDILKDVRKEYATSSNVFTPKEIQLCATAYAPILSRFRARALDVNRHITWRTMQKWYRRVKPQREFISYPTRSFTAKAAAWMTEAVAKRPGRKPSRAKHVRMFKMCRAAAVEDFAKWGTAITDEELEWPEEFMRMN